jgi:hypothetical protein
MLSAALNFCKAGSRIPDMAKRKSMERATLSEPQRCMFSAVRRRGGGF